MNEAGRRLAAVARRQHGLLTRAQAIAAGLSRTTWYRLLERGWLEPVYPNVARLAGVPVTEHQRILAGVLACGDGHWRPTPRRHCCGGSPLIAGASR